jgi:Ca2+-binding RTX toxin-like protein
VVEALVDSSNTATSAATQEILRVVATDNGGVASVLNIDARAVNGFHAINVLGSAVGNDVVTLDANVGGTTSTVNLGGGTGDRVNFTGTANGDGVPGGAVGVTINLATGATAFSTGGTTTNHVLTGNTVEIIDISAMTYDDSVITGGAAAETIIGGAGNDSITGGAGADTITTGAGSDTVVLAAGSMGAVGVNTSADTITDFSLATDTIKFSLTGQAGSVVSNANNVAVTPGAAVVQHIAPNTPTVLNAATNVVVLDGVFLNAAAMIAAIGGGTTALTQASAFTANSDLVVVWSDGTNSHVSLINDANSVSDAPMLAADLTATEIVTLSGINPATLATFGPANFSFIA